MDCYVYFQYIVSDDDTTMKKQLTYHDKRPADKNHIREFLPKEIEHVDMEINNMIPSGFHCNFPCNYDGSLESMEISVMMYLMKILYTIMGGCAYVQYIVSDDYTTMKKQLTYPDKRHTDKNNTGECLPKEISVHTWYADPTHCTKCVSGAFY